MFGIRPFHETILMQEAGGDPFGGGGTTAGGGIGDVPQPVLLQLWLQAKSNPAEFQRLITQWLAQQDALKQIAGVIPPNVAHNGMQTDEFHWVDPATGNVFELRKDASGKPTVIQLSDGDSERYLLSIGVDPSMFGGGGGPGGGGPGGGGGGADDPRYWDMQNKQLQLQYDQLAAQYQNMGLDAESARRQALTTLITNRNNASVDLANTSGNIAAKAAEFAANPRDAVADLMYRNAVGGSTPFGDTNNAAFPQYQTALQDKFQELFGGVAGDLSRAREFVSQIPPTEYFGAETRGQLGLPPTPAQQLAGGSPGGTGATPAGVPAPTSEQNPLAILSERLNALTPQQADDFRKWTTAAAGAPQGFAMGGKLNFDTTASGFSPATSEGGTNMNIHEPAVIIGLDSKHVYARLAEPRPDGTRRGEQLIIKPLPSEVKKDREMEKQGKQAVQHMGKGFAEGGTVNALPDASSFIDQLRKQLSGLGGSGGGTGGFDGSLPSPRLLAGSPWQSLLEDPDLMDYALAGFSAQGISPRSMAATVKKFTPNAPINNLPRVSFA